MIQLIHDHQQALENLCRKYWVKSLEIFGSAVSGRFDRERSDVDLLIEFLPMAPGEYANAYFGLKDELEALFGRPVDLVMPRAITNRFFLEAIAEQRELIYAA